MTEMIKYFHKLTAEEFKVIVDKKITYGQLAIDYPQPKWCNYPEATSGSMGCWSLMAHMVKNRKFCVNCDCSKDFVKKKEIISNQSSILEKGE